MTKESANRCASIKAVFDEKIMRARSGDAEAFRRLTDPHRRELRLHCYRILGSVEDAEDMVQETLVAAWRGIGAFGARAPMRTWLYQIATHRCLNEIRRRRKRPMISKLSFDPPAPTRMASPTWVEPYPDALLEGVPDAAPGPEARYESREAVELAFILALQQLPPRQRAVLILRDVLGFRAAEAADMLDMTETSVKSGLQRASRRDARRRTRARLPEAPVERAITTRFADAFIRGDVDAVVAILTDDAWARMPPAPFEYQGTAAVAAFLRAMFAARGHSRLRLTPVRANTQPALLGYLQDPQTKLLQPAGILVLTIAGDRISDVTRFESSAAARFAHAPGTPDRWRDTPPAAGAALQTSFSET